MSLRINDIVPDFRAETTQGTINFHNWIGDGWAILFSHPNDFTPVCTTELGAVARLEKEWKQRDTKVIGLSVDNVGDHKKWIEDIERYSGASVTFPIISDTRLDVSKLYDMLPAEAFLPDGRTPIGTATLRTVYIIGPDKRLKLSMTYRNSVGRQFDEILRALDALQTASKNNVATPANWRIGDDIIIPLDITTEQARERFEEIKVIFPYLRNARL